MSNCLHRLVQKMGFFHHENPFVISLIPAILFSIIPGEESI